MLKAFIVEKKTPKQINRHRMDRVPLLLICACSIVLQLSTVHSQGEDNLCDNEPCNFGGLCQEDPQTSNERCVCSEFCASNYAPVCGLNGETYSNECHLKVAECQTQTAIGIDNTVSGECPVNPNNMAANPIGPVTWYTLMTSFFLSLIYL